jgi:tetratricopeptide (TPR) repeat protein
MFQAQLQFERDSFTLALTNPGGGFSGFLDIIDNYKGTPAANIANYYAGISYLNLGQYEAALDYLKTYKASGEIGSMMKYGAMGDAYSELNDLDKALKNYKSAVSAADNEALTPYYLKKLGMLYEKQGKYSDAKSLYQRIKTEYPESPIAVDIEKYIVRASSRG